MYRLYTSSRLSSKEVDSLADFERIARVQFNSSAILPPLAEIFILRVSRLPLNP